MQLQKGETQIRRLFLRHQLLKGTGCREHSKAHSAADVSQATWRFGHRPVVDKGFALQVEASSFTWHHVSSGLREAGQSQYQFRLRVEKGSGAVPALSQPCVFILFDIFGEAVGSLVKLPSDSTHLQVADVGLYRL